MTHLVVADEIAAHLAAQAAAHKCTTDDMLRLLLSGWKDEESMAESLYTPALGARFADDLTRPRSEFMTSEETDLLFEKLYSELESR